jgi:DNA invertase Pin-like site-specific DNA recombinase
MTTFGYARVSTDGQTLDAQVAALKTAGAEKIFSEKQSGAKTDRAALARVLAALESGDVLMVTRLDRLARSTRDLLNVLVRSRRLLGRRLSQARDEGPSGGELPCVEGGLWSMICIAARLEGSCDLDKRHFGHS